MKTTSKGFLFRFPRIAAIVFILFISMFAADILGNGYTFWQTVIGLIMHLIPTWILIIVLVLSRRKYPLVGAVVYGLFGLGYIVLCLVQFFGSMGTPGQPVPYYLLTWPLIIAFPALLVGVSFFFNWRHMQKK